MTKKTETTESSVPQIGTPQIKLLEKLCNATAVSGDEHEVRQIVLAEIKDIVDKVVAHPNVTLVALILWHP